MMICMFKLIHYCLQMFLKKLRHTCVQIYRLDPSHFLSAPGLAWQVKVGQKNTKKKEVINNLNTFYNSREEVIKLFRDLTEMLSDSNDDVRQNKTEGTGLKILTPKQMIQRLPIALAQVKAGNNSENLLNEIRQIV